MRVLSDPAVVPGLGLLGVPPLPDLALLDDHITEIDTAAAYHRQLAFDGENAYRLARFNEGPAADAMHTFVTGREGALPEAGDLANRLTSTADSLRVARDTVEWVAGLLAGVAVAAGIAAVTTPQLLPRLVDMAQRYVAMMRTALSTVGRIFRVVCR
ncbi:hypothetical protein [Streptosporangium sp. KLBMP 9127]|nr:hypothetical protein [Streptosporangium sp. KLBMP 9127]